MSEQPKILKLSASSIKTYDQCPKKYYYQYIEKLDRKQWDHFSIGNLCHKTLELFHKIYMEEGLKKKKSLSNLMSHAFSEARKNFPNLRGELLKDSKQMILDYLTSIKASKEMPMVKGVETSFEFSLCDNVIIRGILDRIDILKDGTFNIVDYKTNKNPKYLDSFQLLIYGVWLKEKYPEIESFKATFILLKHASSKREFEFNTEDLNSTRKKLIKFAEKIGNDNEWITIPNHLCNWCDFKNVCSASKAW